MMILADCTQVEILFGRIKKENVSGKSFVIYWLISVDILGPGCEKLMKSYTVL